MSAARKLRGSLSVLLSSALVFGALVIGAPAASAEELAPTDQVATTSQAEQAEQTAAPADAPSAPSEEQPAPASTEDPASADAPADQPTTAPAAEQSAADAPAEAAALNTGTPASLEQVRENGGALDWGFKASWRAYVVGAAHGTQTPYAGATLNSDGSIRFQESSTSTYDPEAGTGVIAYTGGVLWASAAHGFSIALQNPRVEVAADGSATVTAETSADETAGTTSMARVHVATISGLGEAVETDGRLTWSNVQGVFASGVGPGTLSGYAGQATDPFTLSTPAPAEEPAPVWNPAIEVAFADGTPVTANTKVYDGDELVVSGSGFDPESHPASGRPPITAGDPSGNYVVFGNFGENWKPSAGAASTQRKVANQKWALTDATYGNIAAGYLPMVTPDRVVLEEDGSFEAKLTVKAAAETPGTYGVFTYVAGGGAADASQELELRLDYQAGERPKVWEPAIEVAFADGTPITEGTKVYRGDKLRVSGTGFDPESNVGGRGAPIPADLPQGSYAVFGNFAEQWKPSESAPNSARKAGPQAWVLAESVLDQVPVEYQGAIRKSWSSLSEEGSFTWEVTLETPAALEGGRYGIYTYAAGGMKNADQELAFLLDYVDAERPAFDPAVQVTFPDGTPVGDSPVYEGDKLVVSGTGFDPYANVFPEGSGIPIPNTLPQGTFAVFGSFGENWRPSAGAASDQRKMDASNRTWLLAEDTLEQIPDNFQSTIRNQWTELSPEGAFSWTVTVKAPAEPVANGKYGIYTYAGGVSGTNADQEIAVPINYQGHRSGAAATIAGFSTGEEGLSVDVTGTGFTTAVAPSGVYAAVVETGAEILNGKEATIAAVSYIRADSITDGAFEQALAATPDKLDREKSYEVLVWKAHGPATAETTFLRAPLALTTADWDRIYGPSTQRAFVDPEVTAASEQGLNVAADISRIQLQPGDAGVYAAVIEAGTESELSPGSMGLAVSFITKDRIVDGKASSNFDIASEKLDRGKSYEVLVWRAHGNATEDRILGRGAIEVTEAQWDDVFGAPESPEGDAVVTAATEAGLGYSANLRGFSPQAFPNGAYIGLVEAGTADAASRESVLGAQWVRVFPESGAVSQALTVEAADLDRAKQYEVLVWPARTLPSAENNVLVMPLAISAAHWDRIFPADLASGSFEWGVRESFRSYVTGPIAHGKITVQSPASGSSVYKFPQVKGGTWNAETGLGTVEFAGLVNFYGHGGSLNLDLANPVVEVTSEKRALLKAPHGATGELLTIATLDLANAVKKPLDGGAVRYEKVAVALTEAGANDYFEEYLDADSKMDAASFTLGAATDAKPVDPPVKPEKPKPTPAPVPAPAPVSSTGGQQAGSLTWGVSSGFAAYATGPIAKGAVSTSGVGGGAGGYLFPQAGSTWNAASQTGTVQYSGVVTFSGHKGKLSTSFANPVISVTSATSGTITSGGRTFGLNLAAGSKSVGANGEVTWSGVPLSGSISGGGNGGGGSFSPDPVSFTVGAASGASFGSTSVGNDDTKRTAAATPPATTGIRVLTPADEIVPGGEIEFEAAGFDAKERDILVVVYSDPIVLDDAAGADANGVVRWIGNLPEDLPVGEHTITLQGSTDAGAIIDVVEKEKKVKKASLTSADGELIEAAPAQAAVLGVADDAPMWMWWVGAAGLLVLAGAMTGLVVAQRRRSAQD